MILTFLLLPHFQRFKGWELWMSTRGHKPLRTAGAQVTQSAFHSHRFDQTSSSCATGHFHTCSRLLWSFILIYSNDTVYDRRKFNLSCNFPVTTFRITDFHVLISSRKLFTTEEMGLLKHNVVTGGKNRMFYGIGYSRVLFDVVNSRVLACGSDFWG